MSGYESEFISNKQYFKKNIERNVKLITENHLPFSKELRDILSRSIEIDPTSRGNIDFYATHDWFVKDKNFHKQITSSAMRSKSKSLRYTIIVCVYCIYLYLNYEHF